MEWMRFYASLDEEYQNIPVRSIRDFKEFHLVTSSKYFAFLDEFKGAYANVFIKNNLRACGIVCVVSNANVDVTHCVESRQNTSSRDYPAHGVWFTVI